MDEYTRFKQDLDKKNEPYQKQNWDKKGQPYQKQKWDKEEVFRKHDEMFKRRRK